MEKKKNKKNVLLEKRKAGLTIIFVTVICLIVSLCGAGVWFSNINFTSNSLSDDSISGDGKYATIDNDINTDELFDSMYYVTLDTLSNSVAFGTNWLSICTDSNKTLDGKIYYKVCDSEFKTKNDVITYLRKYISNDLASKMVGEQYLDYNNELYVIPYSLDRDERYIQMDSYNIVSESNDKIVYNVKSMYSDIDCVDNCNYTYKINKFVIEKINSRWVVSEMEMPY
ncbi:MAG: hypothetical protein PUD59_04590 [bacterium]|nr:hypothetical protein [bacterium]